MCRTRLEISTESVFNKLDSYVDSFVEKLKNEIKSQLSTESDLNEKIYAKVIMLEENLKVEKESKLQLESDYKEVKADLDRNAVFLKLVTAKLDEKDATIGKLEEENEKLKQHANHTPKRSFKRKDSEANMSKEKKRRVAVSPRVQRRSSVSSTPNFSSEVLHQFSYNLSAGTNGSRDKLVLLKNGKMIIIGNEKHPCMLLNTLTKAVTQLKLPECEKYIVSAVKQRDEFVTLLNDGTLLQVKDVIHDSAVS